MQRQSDKSKLRSNPIIGLMSVIWKFCAISDAKKHASQTPPKNIEKIRDIPYISDSNIYHRLDVYYPQNTEKKLPVIIDIHGGGWMYGTKELNEYYCLSLADRGYTVFNINYRLVPDATVDEQLRDVAAALKWIGENMHSYPCDADNIMLTGDSAGGQLAVYSAVLAQSEKLREIFDVQNADMRFTALLLTSPVPFMNDGSPISLYTKILWGTDYRQKPTYKYMNLDDIISYAQLPPTYLITSSGDSLARSQTHKAQKLLSSAGVYTKIMDYGSIEGKKQPHVFSVLDPFSTAGKTAIDGAVSFYNEIINKKTAATADAAVPL